MQRKQHLSHAPAPPSGNVRMWRESNCDLALLLARHRQLLSAAIATAEAIGRGIDELTLLMAALCRRTCRFCPEPCCITNTVWFDFQDLLFFHLTRTPIPARQAASDPMAACPFLGGHGCRQPPRLRPWMCIQYLCPAQRAILTKQGAVSGDVWDKIKTIKDQRDRMEGEVVSCIRNNPWIRDPEMKKQRTTDARGEGWKLDVR